MAGLSRFRDGRCEVENQYRRVVRDEGNLGPWPCRPRSSSCVPHFEWRGDGLISQSVLRFRPDLRAWDADVRYEVPGVRVADPRPASAARSSRGPSSRGSAKVFGTACLPETPIGTCMVSSAGACAAYHNYGRVAVTLR